MSPDAKDLLRQLNARGIRAFVDQKRQLRIKAPRGALKPEELASIRLMREDLIQLLGRFASDVTPLIRPRPDGCPIPLTPEQRAAWNECLQERRTSTAPCITATHLTGALDVPLLIRSGLALVSRHESLRTRIVIDGDGILRQQVGAEYSHRIELLDAPEDAMDTTALYVDIREFGRRATDFSCGPVFAMRIYTLSPYHHVLVVVMDHIVADFYSLEIFKKELWALYFQELRGLPSPLTRPCMQFGDFAVWLEQTHALWKRDHEPYWMEKLAGCPRVIIPSMPEGLVADTSAGSKSEFCFGERLSAAIAGLARSEKVLTPLVVLTFYLLSMSSLCGTRDLLVRFVVNERNCPQLENIIGCLSGHLYLRVEIQQQDTLAGLLRKVSEEFHAANDHYDFGRVPEMFPDLRTDLYFNWYPTFDEQWLEGHQAGAAVPITMESLQIVEARSFDFPIFLFTEGPRGILGSIEYRPSLLATNVVEQLVSRMLSLAEDFSMSPLASVTPHLGAVAGAICP